MKELLMEERIKNSVVEIMTQKPLTLKHINFQQMGEFLSQKKKSWLLRLLVDVCVFAEVFKLKSSSFLFFFFWHGLQL